MSKVVTRFPPSPTGYFHIGSARTALFNYLFTAHEGGTMYLRFEDTDKARSKKEFEDDILAGLEWLGISYTKAEPLRQSERLDAYRAYLHALIEKGSAYEAEESESGGKVIRFKNPNVRIEFSDLVRGDVSFDTAELKDFVIARNIEAPLYHLAVVADDHDMGVTHVIRGEDHISNTPRQILILEALQFERPHYAHIPLILAPDKSKLSKRYGAVSLNEYREQQGLLPEAMVNYLALLGWNPDDTREIFSLDELVQKFDLKKIHKGGAIFDTVKLKWVNRQHLLLLPETEFAKIAIENLRRVLEGRSLEFNATIAERLVPLIRERIETWNDLRVGVAFGEFDYFFAEPIPDAAKIAGKGNDAAAAERHLGELRKLLEALPSSGDIQAMQVKQAVWDYAEKEGRGAVLWPLRYSLTGREKSPDPFIVAAIIGREVTLRRLDAAIKALKTL